MADPDDGVGPDLLTKEQQALLTEWIERVVPYFGLSGWEVELSRKPCTDKDALASTYLRHEMDLVTILVSEKWLASDEMKRRITLAHELLHPSTHRMIQMAFDLVEDEIGLTAERFFRTTIRTLEEQALDRLARGLAKLLPPLPDL